MTAVRKSNRVDNGTVNAAAGLIEQQIRGTRAMTPAHTDTRVYVHRTRRVRRDGRDLREKPYSLFRVPIDGTPVLSCFTLAAMVGDRLVTTIEGLAARDGTLHPMQQAFVDYDAFQCGYRTPEQARECAICRSRRTRGCKQLRASAFE